MSATISTKNATLKHEIMIDAIWTSVSVNLAKVPVLPFGNQLFKHRNLLFNALKTLIFAFVYPIKYISPYKWRNDEQAPPNCT